MIERPARTRKKRAPESDMTKTDVVVAPGRAERLVETRGDREHLARGLAGFADRLELDRVRGAR